MTVTFCGNRDAPDKIKGVLKQKLVQLIENERADMFYCGSQGNFDTAVLMVLRELKKEYPHIDYAVVLAYMPIGSLCNIDPDESIFPSELANVPPKFAINKRNLWMLLQSDVAVIYTNRGYGGTYSFKKSAKKLGRCVIELL